MHKPGVRHNARLGAESWAITVLGFVIAVSARGHFIMPHADFLDFVDSGHAWLAGEFAGSMKRAPLFPLLVVLLGKLVPVPAAERVVAEWFNVALLALNGLLVYWIVRPWLGRLSRWVAVWFLLLPLGVYCTAHVLLEPLLTTMILVTILLAARGSRWAYVVAALATMTRYDAAGLIAGVALTDLLRMRQQVSLATDDEPAKKGNAWRGVVLRTAFAFAPLVVWLLITAVTWSRNGGDHYLTQIAERPVFNPLYALRIGFDAAFPVDLLRVSAWRIIADEGFRLAMLIVPVVLALGGVCWRLRERDAGVLVGLAFFGGYVFVHAIFPFEMQRFGYPPAPVLLIWAAAGAVWITRWRGWQAVARGVVPRIVLTLIGIMFVVALVDEARAFGTAFGGAGRFIGRVGLLVMVALTLIWATPWLTRRRLARVVTLLGVVLLFARQMAGIDPLIGTGEHLKNQVAAVHWIREQQPEARVLSVAPGLLRLYVSREDPERYLSFFEIAGETWDEVVADCRARGVDLIIWHDQIFAEHGSYYTNKWGLERFKALDDFEAAPEVQLERAFPGKPKLFIVRLLR